MSQNVYQSDDLIVTYYVGPASQGLLVQLNVRAASGQWQNLVIRREDWIAMLETLYDQATGL